MPELHDLLSRAADLGGGFVAPAGDSLRSRARRRSRVRGVVAGVSVVVLVAALAVGLAWRGHREATPAAFDPSKLPGSTGPVVTAEDLTKYRWRQLPSAPIDLQGRDGTSIAWTGQRLFVWGGVSGSGYHADGALYDPASRTWTVLPPSPLSGRQSATTTVVDDVVIVWGGRNSDGTLTDGALYDPTIRSWRSLPPLAVEGARQWAFGAGDELVVLTAKIALETDTVRVAAFDVPTASWHDLPDLPLPPDHGDPGLYGLTVGPTLFVWDWWTKEIDLGNTITTENGVDAYALTDDTWVSAPTLTPPPHEMFTDAFWTGSNVVLAGLHSTCKYCHHLPFDPDYLRTQAALVDPTTGTITRTSASPVGAAGAHVWTNGALAVINIYKLTAGPGGKQVGGSAAWDPATNDWTALPLMPNTVGTDLPTAFWTGDRILVWTGNGGFDFAP